ncbi:MAG: porphobilinogen synthase [Leptospirales bacterium]
MSQIRRPRRNRRSEAIRSLVRETYVPVEKLIHPIFIVDGENKKIPVESMPGIFRFSLDLALEDVRECLSLGIQSVILFPAIEEKLKDATASYSTNPENINLRAIREIKKHFPEITVITDVAMDPYSSDGHDGLVKDGQILNDETLPILAKMALAQAEAGADILGPSDMMDGRVGFLREALDDAGYTNVGIMSYTAKYASAFYGPFRDALDSAPKAGDKKTYQMDYANTTEALIEAELDTLEGADYLIVKPALAYLDIIKTLKQNCDLPIVAYNVSGEYSMVKAAAIQGWLEEDKIMVEMLTSIRRAGADIIITYFAKQYAKFMKS